MTITREKLAALGSLALAMGMLAKAQRELNDVGIDTGNADIDVFLSYCHSEVFCRLADEMAEPAIPPLSIAEIREKFLSNR